MLNKKFTEEQAQICAKAVEPLLHLMSMDDNIKDEDILAKMYEDHICFDADGLNPHQLYYHTQLYRALRTAIRALEPMSKTYYEALVPAA